MRDYCEKQYAFHQKHSRFGSIHELLEEGYLDWTWKHSRFALYEYTEFYVNEQQFELIAVAMYNDYGLETNYHIDERGQLLRAVGTIPSRDSLEKLKLK